MTRSALAATLGALGLPALAWEEVLARFETRHAGKGRPGRDAAADDRRGP
jgi:hypothetical protein